MHFLDVVYNKYYLPTIINRKKAMKRNKNTDFTLLCGNCMGGYIYHQLGLEFKSPTINTMILQPDFYKLVTNLQNYTELDFTEEHIDSGVPCGRIGDICVFFTHYSSFEDGVKNGKDGWNVLIMKTYISWQRIATEFLMIK